MTAARLPIMLMASILMIACASPGARQPAPGDPLMQRLAAALGGDYATSPGDRSVAKSLISVAAEPVLGETPLVLNMVQESEDGGRQRFRLAISRSDTVSGFSGQLAAIDTGGRVLVVCPVTVALGEGRLNVSTRQDSCRFGQGDEGRGLIKEMAFDGQRIRIAEQVVSDDGLPQSDARTLSFHRLARFSGWAGVLEGERWRVTRDLDLDTASVIEQPVDAAGMSLGIAIELDFYTLEDSDMLRLTAIDLATGQTLGRAWAEPTTELIGLALPDLQIGLRRLR